MIVRLLALRYKYTQWLQKQRTYQYFSQVPASCLCRLPTSKTQPKGRHAVTSGVTSILWIDSWFRVNKSLLQTLVSNPFFCVIVNNAVTQSLWTEINCKNNLDSMAANRTYAPLSLLLLMLLLVVMVMLLRLICHQLYYIVYEDAWRSWAGAFSSLLSWCSLR